MSESAPTEGASAASGEQPGSEGTPPGTQAAADTFATERETLTTRARTEQARADRAEAQLRELQAAASKPEGAKDTATPAAPVDPEALVQKALSEFRRSEGLRTTAEALRSNEAFQYGDKSLLDDPESYDSPEALTAAFEASHKRVADLIAGARDTITAEVQAEIAQKYGINLAPPAPKNDGTPGGDPTPEQLNSMSMAELAALDPEVIDRVLRSSI